jgi:hypothetical protein
MVEARARRGARTLVLAGILASFVAVGVAVRLRLWWWDAELANDDILLMTGALSLPLPDLAGPMPNGQGAPPLWLLAERGFAEWLGDDERSLRLLPMLFGCAQVAVFAVLARKALGPVAAILGTALVALSPFATLYSATAKQYSADLFVSTALMLLALLVARRGRADWLAAAAWWPAAIVGGGLSHPSLLLTPALTAVLAVALLGSRRGAPRAVRRLPGVAGFCAPGVLWAAGACWMYTATLAKVATPGIKLWWQDGYRPEGAGVRATAEFVGRALTAFTREVLLAGTPGADRAVVVALTLAAAGAGLLVWRDRLVAAVVLTPPAVAVAAAVAGVFPLEKRMALWILPAAVLLVAAVADGSPAVLRWRPAAVARAAVAAAGAVAVLVGVAVPVTASAAYELRQPGRRDLTGTDPAYADDNRPIIAAMRRAHRPGDVLVTMDAQHQATLWYSGRSGIAPYGYLVVDQNRSCPAGAWLATAPPAPRYLVIAGSPWRRHPRSDERALVEDLAKVGTVELLDARSGVRLWAYTPPAGTGSPRARSTHARSTRARSAPAKTPAPPPDPRVRGACVALR